MKKNLCLIGMILVLSFITLFGCANNTQKNIKLYFSNAEKTELKTETRTYKGNVNVDTILDELLKGPSDLPLVRIIPKGTKLLSSTKEGDLVNLDFSSEYKTLSAHDELLARHSIAKTVFEIEGINRIKIFIGGTELLNSSGESVGEISKDSLITTPTENIAKYENVTLYFSDEAAMYVVPEVRNAPLIDNSLEKTIVTELIKGPENKALLSTIPDGTKLLSIETKDSICFVNFSQDFVTKHNGGSAGEYLTVYSIVNSLTELENVEKVQFLVEGNKLEIFKHMEFGEPFSRDADAIAK
ncbi:MAG: hypothetical protein E7404_00955 [Ruminococcaceae bacterium]|nr:hypothetical protein [Oscillospiraceae bacterium]